MNHRNTRALPGNRGCTYRIDQRFWEQEHEAIKMIKWRWREEEGLSGWNVHILINADLTSVNSFLQPLHYKTGWSEPVPINGGLMSSFKTPLLNFTWEKSRSAGHTSSHLYNYLIHSVEITGFHHMLPIVLNPRLQSRLENEIKNWSELQ